MTWPLLLVVGVAVGTFGTLVGAGGGFILTPLLLILYPNFSPATVTSISLFVVFFNALSGSLAYGRLGRIDYDAGIRFALAAIPGSVLGALAVHLVPVRVFDAIMAAALAATAGFVTRLRPHAERPRPRGNTVERQMVDRDGNSYRYWVPLRRGSAYSALVGFASSFLGIGGGVIHVPILVGTLGFPTHIAAATSHFVLTFATGAATVTHLLGGTFSSGSGLAIAVPLAIGVVPGAQLGAWIARKMAGPSIRRLLGGALLILAVRLLVSVAV
ncbi:MAG: sulfite exporter TauE/SafE family protein [Actinobacteria bacterium]|nr:sulfite exporter TauE/SafE family protein [Actinomycetota bacterium]